MKFSVTNVLNSIKQNKKKHEQDLREAKENYKKKLISVLADALDEATLKGRLTEYLHLPALPPNHLDDYDRVISMLEQTSEDSVELTQKEYSQFVLDDWEWKNDFRNVSSSYLTSNVEK